MTKSTITKTDIQMILDDDWLLMDDCEGLKNSDAVKMLARMALAAMDSEPVIIVGDDSGDALSYRRLLQSFAPGTKLYLHAQPAPVVPEDVRHALSKMDDEITAELNAEESACRAAMLQANSDDDGEPTDDERIMAIEGITPSLDEHVRYESNAGGNLWIQCSRHKFEKMKQAGMLTRMLYERPEAGNSPVIGIDLASGPDRTVEVRYVAPPGYVMVPKEPTDEMLAAAKDWTGLTSTAEVVYIKMLAASPQEVKP